MHQALQAQAAPALCTRLAAGKERLGKATQAHHVVQAPNCLGRFERGAGRGREVTLAQGEGVQPIGKVASEQAVTTAAVEIQPGTARHDDALFRTFHVVVAFELRLPAAALVDFVEHQHARPAICQGRARRTGPSPAEVTVIPASVVVGRRQEPPGQGGLANLAGTAEESHFA